MRCKDLRGKKEHASVLQKIVHLGGKGFACLMSLKRLTSNQFHIYWVPAHAGDTKKDYFSLRRVHSNYSAPPWSADPFIYICSIS